MNTKNTARIQMHPVGGTICPPVRVDLSAPTVMVQIAAAQIKASVNRALYDPALCAKMFGNVSSAENTADTNSEECVDGVCQMKPSFIEKLRKQHAEKLTEAG